LCDEYFCFELLAKDLPTCEIQNTP
jgi:hypothetical protein